MAIGKTRVGIKSPQVETAPLGKKGQRFGGSLAHPYIEKRKIVKKSVIPYGLKEI